MADETQLESVAEDVMDSIADEAPEEAPAEGAEQMQEGQQAPAEGDAKADAEAPAEGQQEAQKAEPEDYVLEAGEDFAVPEDNLKSFTAACKKAGLTKAQAEAMLSWHRDFAGDVSRLQAQQESQTLKGWQDEILHDPEIGGQNWKAAVADSRRALAHFDTDGSLRQLLKQTHADYNPAVVRCIARIGRAMREDQFVTSKGGGNSAKALEDRMWPDMQV